MVVEYESCVSSTFHHLLAYYFISLITSVRCPSVAHLERSSPFGERAHVASSASSRARGDSPASCQLQRSCLKTMSRYVQKPNTKITGAALKRERGRRSRAVASGRVRSWGDGCALSPVGWQLQKGSGGLFSKGLEQFSVGNGRLRQLAGAHGGGLGGRGGTGPRRWLRGPAPVAATGGMEVAIALGASPTAAQQIIKCSSGG